MVHGSMRDGSRVGDEMFIMTVSLPLEDFHFFCHHTFFRIGNQARLCYCLDCCLVLNFSIGTSSVLGLVLDMSFQLPISLMPDPTHFIELSLIVPWQLFNVLHP
jgi:hypothetical protein